MVRACEGVLAAGVAAAGLDGSAAGGGTAPLASPSPSLLASSASLSRDETVARQTCTACHAFPPPDILPREAWTATVYEMAGRAGTSRPWTHWKGWPVWLTISPTRASTGPIFPMGASPALRLDLHSEKPRRIDAQEEEGVAVAK